MFFRVGNLVHVQQFRKHEKQRSNESRSGLRSKVKTSNNDSADNGVENVHADGDITDALVLFING